MTLVCKADFVVDDHIVGLQFVIPNCDLTSEMFPTTWPWTVSRATATLQHAASKINERIPTMTDEATTLNVGRPPHDTSAGRREEILRMHEEGMTGVAIARQLGITPGAVSYHLKKARAVAALVNPDLDGE